MTTDQLRLFLTIARHRSLARAAAELDIGQATVSERLKALDELAQEQMLVSYWGPGSQALFAIAAGRPTLPLTRWSRR